MTPESIDLCSDEKRAPEDAGATCVILFLKAPVKGKVKTRLAGEVGDDAALELHRCFAADVLQAVRDTGLPFCIYVHPEGHEKSVREWLGAGPEIRPQRGTDLGARMVDAFRRVFEEGYDKALLVGSDFPDIPPDIFRRGAEELEHHPAVLGPAEDGGYYLIGFRRRGGLEAFFEDMPWGTDSVFRKTAERLSARKVSVSVLPMWRDIDTLADLKRFMEVMPETEGRARHTRTCLKQKNFFRTIRSNCVSGGAHGCKRSF